MTRTEIRMPRRRPAPSPRDQQIYIDYQVGGMRQIELARQHRLTQCRISQIIRRVERWRRRLSPHDTGGDISFRQRQRLDRWLERELLTTVCREAMRQFHEGQKIITHKTGTRGDKTIDETTERRQTANVQ